MTGKVIKIGAVAYDPKVVTIWEGMCKYFLEKGIATDYLLFSNYAAQVDALFNRIIDIAWNTNVAFVRCEQRAGGRCLALGMRNTDLDFTTRIVARRDRAVSSLQDLKGKRLALGSADSAQAAIMPLYYLGKEGIDIRRDLDLVRFDLDVGKHGDTGGSEMAVLRALQDGAVDAGAVGHAVWLRELEQGHVNTGLLHSVWTSPPYSHCNFTALPDFDHETAQIWPAALMAMDYNNPRWRRIMDLEGVTAWAPGSKEGYKDLLSALE